MKKNQIVTAMTATALALNLVGITANAEEVNTVETPTTGVVETTNPVLPTNDVVSAVLVDNKTYKYDVKVSANSTISIDASALVPPAKGNEGLPPEYIDFNGTNATLVLKDASGKEVVKGEVINGSLFATTEGLPEGTYTVEVAIATGVAVPNGEVRVGFYEEGKKSNITIDGIEADADVTALKVGQTIKLKGVNVTEGVLTQVMVKGPNDEDFSVAQEFSPSVEFDFTPKEEGNYTVRYNLLDEATNEVAHLDVDFQINPADENVKPPVVDGGDKEDEDKPSQPSKPTYTKASSLKMSVSKTKVKPKSTVTVTHSAKGTSVKYKVAIKQKGERNKLVKAYTSAKKVSFKAPTKKGKYIVSVYAKSSKGGKSVHTTKVITVK